MKIFISQPMKGYSNFEIEIIRGKIKEALKEKYGNDIEIIDSFIKGAPQFLHIKDLPWAIIRLW